MDCVQPLARVNNVRVWHSGKTDESIPDIFEVRLPTGEK